MSGIQFLTFLSVIVLFLPPFTEDFHINGTNKGGNPHWIPRHFQKVLVKRHLFSPYPAQVHRCVLDRRGADVVLWYSRPHSCRDVYLEPPTLACRGRAGDLVSSVGLRWCKPLSYGYWRPRAVATVRPPAESWLGYFAPGGGAIKFSHPNLLFNLWNLNST